MTEEEPPIAKGKSQHWLDLIENGEKVLDDWQSIADGIDKQYADSTALNGIVRDREFQLFWSNIQVMGPAIYARPPVPVVTPKFKDRRPLYRTASELLERTCVVSFDMADIDQVMLGLRDDLTIVGRGASWVRYESDDGDKVCYEHVDRKDFAHEPARKWSEVDWVARCAWLTQDEMKERFGADKALEVDYQTRRDEKLSSAQKCGVWEIWCKSENKVVWVTEGYENTLDESEPYLKLAGFFPCPRPAYATVQRRTLIPVPDMLMYKDQLEEVNALTRRIHSLADAIRVRGFYAGGGDVGAAIQTAIDIEDDAQVLIAIPAMQALMQGSGDPIMWLPLDIIAQTITGLIELRRQIIEDVYQIIGLSDIMRGSTQAEETLGAQRLKQQNGSARVRDKQSELVRVARDLVRIGAEIMAEEFDEDTLIDMAQMDLPTNADVKKQLEEMTAAAEEEMRALVEKAQGMAPQQGQEQPDPQQMQQLQQQFEQAQQAIIAKWQPEIKKAGEAVTIDAVMEFLKDEKLRPYVLDIETDSTIYPDEMAEKASRQEFMGAFSDSMQRLMPLMQMGPEAVSVAGGVIKFALSPYRVGRELEGLIDDFVDGAPAMVERMQAEGGESEDLAAANMKLAEAETMKAQAAMENVKAKATKDQADMQGKMQDLQLKASKDQQEGQLKVGQLKLTMSKQEQDFSVRMAEAEAKINKTQAETAAILQSIGLDVRKQDLEEYKAAENTQAKQVEQAMSAEDRQRQAVDGPDRQQQFAEKVPENG